MEEQITSNFSVEGLKQFLISLAKDSKNFETEEIINSIISTYGIVVFPSEITEYLIRNNVSINSPDTIILDLFYRDNNVYEKLILLFPKDNKFFTPIPPENLP